MALTFFKSEADSIDESDADEKFLCDLLADHLRYDPRGVGQNLGIWYERGLDSSQRGFLGLTARECEVMNGLSAGQSDAQIGASLSCATKTVGKHVEHILAKLGAETRLAAVWTAQERLRAQHR